MSDATVYVSGNRVGGAPISYGKNLPKNIQVREQTALDFKFCGHNDVNVPILTIAQLNDKPEWAQDILQKDKPESLESSVGRVEEIERTQSGRRAARRRSELPDPTKSPGHEVNKLEPQWRARMPAEEIDHAEIWRVAVGLSRKDASRYALRLARGAPLDRSILKELGIHPE